LENKIFQLIIGRLDGDRIASQEYEEYIFRLVKSGIGGFIVFGGKKEEVKAFIGRIQTLSEIPLFVASDIEHGVAQQIGGATLFPSQMAVAAAINRDDPADVALLKEMLEAIACEADACGINMPLIPVLDVNVNPDNPIICTRAFSDDPEMVAWFGSEYIKILEGSGLITCGKHFPGHGDTAVDSHIALPTIAKSYQELLEMDIFPYRQAIEDGVSSIMVGHLGVPAIDGKPASMSANIMSGLLRYKLGFNGLILTDALTMSALKDFGNIPVTCLNAGADILLHPANVEETAREVMEAMKDGMLQEDRLDMVLMRIGRAKERFRAYRAQSIRLGAVNHQSLIANHESETAEIDGGREAIVDYEKHRRISERITEKAITLVKKRGEYLPVHNGGDVKVDFAGDDTYFLSSPLKAAFSNVSASGEAEVSGRTLVLAVFTSVVARKGSSGISPEQREQIARLIDRAKHTIVISFGSPYVLRYFENADVLIAAYDPTEEAQRAVIGCLLEAKPFKGRLPVKIF
jgi:beta-glucosidase-like glycosyl hydrolase